MLDPNRPWQSYTGAALSTAELDRLLQQAVHDLDRSLFHLALDRSLLERLRAGVAAARLIRRFRRAASDDGQLLGELSNADVEFIVVGGMAALLHEAPNRDAVPRHRAPPNARERRAPP